MTVSIGVAVLVVMATVAPASSAWSSDVPPADKTALILGGTAAPTPNDYWVDVVRNQYIEPTHPGQVSDYKAVATPEEFWPIAGLFRVIGVGLVAVDPQQFSLELLANFFPDEPWWKLSGLFDLTVDQSNQAGVADLEKAMTTYGNDALVIYGYSQGASVAIREKRKLAAQYPWGTKAPDISFVLGGDFNLPNGGLAARFPGFYIPIIDWTFNGPEPTDTQFHTDVITRQYDAVADFPLYPLNPVADLNALLGFFFVHAAPFEVSLADDRSTYSLVEHGDTSYYFFKTEDLPLFAPLRLLGVPEPIIDVVEPFFRVLVELGYDRSIPPWEPTPARLVPTLDPAKVITDVGNAIGEGANNALALVGLPPLLSTSAPVTSAAPDAETAKADTSPHVTPAGAPQTSTDTATSTTVAKDDPPPPAQTAKGSEQPTSPKDIAEPAEVSSTTATASQSSTAATPEPSAARALTPKPAKPAGKPAKPRPVLHPSLEADQPATGAADPGAVTGSSSGDGGAES